MMKKEKVKVYIYTRVSTAMQIDGYSLDAQKSRMKAFADFNDYEIVGEYEDAGKSGKSIEGRVEFNRMMEDIKSGKDGVSYVLVFKLSRFGRNAADVLSTLQVMQDFGVIGLCLAYFHVVWKQEGCYYCSEFVGELLTKSRVDGTEQLRSSIIQPMQFLRVPHTLLYCGKLREYVSNTCSEGICEDATNHTVHRRLP